MGAKETESTLVDYFVVAGYDAETGLVVDSAGELEGILHPDALLPPLQKSFVAKILDYFPKKRKTCPFTPEIISLCMPRGLRFYTEKNVPNRPDIHTFANIREDGSRVNGTCITFFEEVRDIGVCEAMNVLQQEHVREVTSGDRVAPRNHVPPGTISGGTHTLPRGRRSVQKRISYYDGGGGTLYMSKTVCVLTRLPLVSATATLLEVLYKMISVQQPPLPIESYIYWMLNEVPCPSSGTALKVKMWDDLLVVQRPTERELPFFDYSLAQLFDIMPIEKFLRLFTAFLLEHQILICSKELSRLMLVCESLCALAFPFRWQLTYVPILPSAQLKFIEAPVPYVMGLCYDDIVPDHLFQWNVCVVDVDGGRFDIPEDLPFFPQHRDLVQHIRDALGRVVVPQMRPQSTRRDGARVRLSRSFDKEMDWPPAMDAVVFDDLENNSTLARVQEIARRAGVEVDVGHIRKELSSVDSPVSRQYFLDIRTNNAVREVILRRMLSTFYSYEHFVIGNALDRNENDRDSLVSFDKAAFLSDQPDSHLPFLAAFLETQMFTSFVDSKLLHQMSPDENVALFDQRILDLRDTLGFSIVQTPSEQKPTVVTPFDDLICQREEQMDYVVPYPHHIPGTSHQPPGRVWPILNSMVLEGSDTMSPVPSPWKQRYPRLRPKGNETARPLSTFGGSGIPDSPGKMEQQNQKFVEQLLREAKSRTKRMLVEKMGKEAIQLGHTDAKEIEENTLVAAFCDLLERIFAHGHVKKQGKSSLWSTVLLHEDCSKLSLTHRSSSSILTPVRLSRPPRPSPRVHSSVVHPSHPPPRPPPPRHHVLPPPPQQEAKDVLASIRGAERDAPAWSASLLRAANSLAERLAAGVEEGGREVLAMVGRTDEKPMKKSNSVTDLASPGWSDRGEEMDRSRRRSVSRGRSPERVASVLPPLPTSLAYDLKNVLRMNEIRSDLGYARAFVRLSLERKLLHSHLSTLLSNSKLLNDSYKSYSFVRCEEEREQLLFHVLSLNAAQFRCFTNTFTKTKMDYQVVLLTGTWKGRIPPVWLLVEGAFCCTPRIALPAATPFFKFDHRNLGVLSTLRIGHSTPQPPKWFLDQILVRNEITGEKYRFPCGRWFGRSVEDGSLERLLVAESLGADEPIPGVAIPSSPAIRRGREMKSRSQTPQRERSPSTGRAVSRSGRGVRTVEVEEMLGDVVNCLVRHLHLPPEKQSRADLAHLLCGEGGLVTAIEAALQCGRSDGAWPARLFGHTYPWDYVEKVALWMNELCRREDFRRMKKMNQELVKHSIRLVKKISECEQLGKEGKFHVFVLLSIKDHTFSAFLQLMAWTPVTADMFDESSILRNPSSLSRLSKLLDSLNEFTFHIDSSLTYGIS